MKKGLQELPFDLVHHIAPYLNARDYAHLSVTCKTLSRYLADDGTAKKALTVRISALQNSITDLTRLTTPTAPLANMHSTQVQTTATSCLEFINVVKHCAQPVPTRSHT
jgi:hypothetical protein